MRVQGKPRLTGPWRWAFGAMRAQPPYSKIHKTLMKAKRAKRIRYPCSLSLKTPNSVIMKPLNQLINLFIKGVIALSALTQSYVVWAGE